MTLVHVIPSVEWMREPLRSQNRLKEWHLKLELPLRGVLNSNSRRDATLILLLRHGIKQQTVVTHIS